MSFYRPLPDCAVYLDDRRGPIMESWEWLMSVAAFAARLEAGDVEHVSLDFNLECSDPGHSGLDAVVWMAETGHWPSVSLQLHTGDYIGRDQMADAIEASGLFDKHIEHPLGPIYLRL